MSAEIEAFRAEMKAAGEPWQQRGIKVVGAGFVVLLAAQLFGKFTFVLLGGSIALFLVGWAMLIVAFLRRRRWFEAHKAEMTPLL